MRNIKFLLQKEFRQIFRNPTILRMIIVMPIMQLILIPLAADYEVKNVSISVVDLDHSTYSRRIIGKLEASPYFKLVDYAPSFDKALVKVEKDKSDLILTIPPKFEKDLIKENNARLHLASNGVNPVKAGLGSAYAAQLINQFSAQIRNEWIGSSKINSLPSINISSANWYNPYINYQLFMVPGILAILVTMIGSFLSALNIVSEKEAGTIEQINVTPLKKYEFILGKLIPFWILGIFSIILGTFVGLVVFGLWPIGSFFAILSIAAIYLLGVLGIGLLISTMVDSQQQATLFAFFFMMIFILLSGLYTPIESMPDWAITITKFNPPAYFIRAIRAIYIKGAGLGDLLPEIRAMILFAIFFNTLAIINYKKTVA